MRLRQHPKIKEFQKRALPINYSSLEIRSDGKLVDSKLDQRIVAGYGSIWGSVNDYDEFFVKGAFAKSISENGPNSNSTYKIKFRDRHGKSVSLFASLIEDDIGLYFETVPLDKVQWADDLLVQLKSGTINNFSIGFKYIWDRVEWDEENDCLIILEAQLFEISAVDIPSDVQTYAVRRANENIGINDEVENFINKLPRKRQLEARRIFSRCMTPIDNAPDEKRSSPPIVSTPPKAQLDLNYLIKKFS